MQCRISEWQAWSPYALSKEQWLEWASQYSDMPVLEDKPALGWVNPMLRRRLSFLSRLMLHVAHQLQLEHKIDAWVFASRHGEIHTTLQLLKDIANEQPLSPMNFSLSVHNSGAGLFSIADNVQAPMTAIAAGKDTLVMAMTDAVVKLARLPEGKIAVVYVEERLCDAYIEHQDGDADALALGLVLGQEGIPLTVRREEHHHESVVEGSAAESLIKLLLSANGEASSNLPAELGYWHLMKGQD